MFKFPNKLRLHQIVEKWKRYYKVDVIAVVQSNLVM